MIIGPRFGGGWAWGWPGLVSSVLFWALVIVAIIALVRFLTRGDRHWGGARWGGAQGYRTGPGPFPPGTAAPPGTLTPEHILAERFARGEIDEQEFRQRMAVLRGAAGQPGAPGTPRRPGHPAARRRAPASSGWLPRTIGPAASAVAPRLASGAPRR